MGGARAARPRGAMAEEFALLRGKLGAARVLLDSGGPGNAQRIAISKGQANAFLDCIQRVGSKLDVEQRAQLQLIAVAAKFEPADATPILDAIVGRVEPPRAGRMQNQDYMNIVFYIDNELWSQLLSSDIPNHGKETMFCHFARRLGLHAPSEYTFKRMAVILMMAAEPWEALQMKPASEKKMEVTLLKAKWHKENKWLGRKPPNYVQFLPKMPQDFCRHDPTWKPGSEVPCEPTMELRKIELMEASFKIRGNVTVTTPPTSPSSSSVLMPVQNNQTLEAIQGFGSMMAHAIQQMSAQQAKLMEVMVVWHAGHAQERGTGGSALMQI